MKLLVVSLIDVPCTKFLQATAGAILVQSSDANATLNPSKLMVGGFVFEQFLLHVDVITVA